jgi:hypothetical protein
VLERDSINNRIGGTIVNEGGARHAIGFAREAYDIGPHESLSFNPSNNNCDTTMNSATTLVTSHAWGGFNPSNINHELCLYTDDVIRMAELQPYVGIS